MASQAHCTEFENLRAVLLKRTSPVTLVRITSYLRARRPFLLRCVGQEIMRGLFRLRYRKFGAARAELLDDTGHLRIILFVLFAVPGGVCSAPGARGIPGFHVGDMDADVFAGLFLEIKRAPGNAKDSQAKKRKAEGRAEPGHDESSRGRMTTAMLQEETARATVLFVAVYTQQYFKKIGKMADDREEKDSAGACCAAAGAGCSVAAVSAPHAKTKASDEIRTCMPP